MPTQRVTTTKRQREQAKRERQQRKAERKANRETQPDDEIAVVRETPILNDAG